HSCCQKRRARLCAHPHRRWMHGAAYWAVKFPCRLRVETPMNTILKSAVAVAAVAFAAQAAAQITIYEREGFQGRGFTTQEQISTLTDYGFEDRAASVVVTGQRWEICEGMGFGGRCTYLRPGQYPSLASMGLSNR